ncbi:caax amino terminal protease family [Leptolyngbya sp. Heron Island J]|uniref:CPBP family intramembrane glutamic endopeptidase n=1 Tax=Leptolyngbya sp. Heron Island J TaxID=1385935 RepID=UPI0003B9CBB5|nr:type II CAAX endopeptidase family protein [Leptolyngbya sp. Heron Island J]ESA37665.1 caax amino terminal protease family [Leptolyngbya sp. Heron Island J]
MARKKSLISLGLITGLAALTFITSATQWLVRNLGSSSQYDSLLSSILIILCIFFWYKETRSFPWFPASSFWKISCYLMGIIVFILLIINILNQPVSKITGQARSLFEVMDVIVFGPIAEELVFRGVMWSIFKRLAQNSHGRVVTLIGTSLLFGVEHLGYWALSYWPLPPAAMMHALLMVGAGAFFAALRLASRSLLAPIAVHMLANGAILLTQ